MKAKLILIVCCFVLNNQLYAQSQLLTNDIDSIAQKIFVTDNDWAIGLSIEQAGMIYDLSGNESKDNISGTFLLFKIGSDYFLQTLWSTYYKVEPTVVSGTRIKLTGDHNLKFTSDSIQSAQQEWIYPFIYKDDRLGAFVPAPPTDHEPYYSMYFKVANKESFFKTFTETNVAETAFYLKQQNLNYNYNINTCTYRIFIILKELIIQNRKAFSFN